MSTTAAADDSRPRAKPTFVGGLVRYPSREDATPRPSEAALTKLQVLLGRGEVCSTAFFRAGLLEFVGTTGLVYVHIGIVRSASASTDPALYIAVAHAVLLAFFILALAAPSGGHVNPTITMATTMTGHTSLARCILYLVAQSLGAIVGSVLMRATLGWDGLSPTDMALCSFGSLTESGAFVAEVVFSFVLLLIAYGIAFDPKQGLIFGPILAPLIIGATLGLLLYASAALSTTPGYAPGMNWAICLGPAASMGAHTSYVYFVGTVLACFLHALLYISAPPHHAEEGCFTPPLLAKLDATDVEMQRQRADDGESEKWLRTKTV